MSIVRRAARALPFLTRTAREERLQKRISVLEAGNAKLRDSVHEMGERLRTEREGFKLAGGSGGENLRSRMQSQATELRELQVKNTATERELVQVRSELERTATRREELKALQAANSELRREVAAAEGALERARLVVPDTVMKRAETHQATIAEQRETISRLKTGSTSERTARTLGRIETFFQGTELTLPPGPWEAFQQKCRDAAPERAEAFLADLAAENYRPIFEQLFAPEMAMAQGFDFKNLQAIVSFQRGADDIRNAERKGVSLDELKGNHIRLTEERFDGFLADDVIDPDRVERAVEIGAAWGAGTRYVQKRYAPDDFHVYEIDTAWAEWLADNLGVDSKNCDGETLAFTDDASVDICLASSCLYFMPWLKQWSYLSEFARVLRPGGIAVFNVNLIENTRLRTLQGLRTNLFPRRVFGYLPIHCLETAFPVGQFEVVVEPSTENFGYHVIRKL